MKKKLFNFQGFYIFLGLNGVVFQVQGWGALINNNYIGLVMFPIYCKPNECYNEFTCRPYLDDECIKPNT